MRKLISPLYLLLLLTLSFISIRAFCDSPVPVISASPKAYLVIPSAASSPAPSPALVQVAEPAAPPAWAQEIMVSAQKLPVVGPVVSKALLYLGIVSSILTMLAGFIMSVASLLSGYFSWAGLTNAVGAIEDFQGGKFMYWLKFFSLFNAKKPDATE